MLNRVHCQRITSAVRIAQRPGHVVTFAVIGEASAAYLVWIEWGAVRGVIASGRRSEMQALLVLAKAEFARELDAAQLSNSSHEERGVAAEL